MHRLYRRADVRAAVEAQLGPDVIDGAGEVDRRAIARRIPGDPGLLPFLEQLLHPLVDAEVRAWRETAARAVPPPRLLVHEVPLLFEAGLEGRYDRTLVVAASEEVRRARLAARGDAGGVEEREARQLPAAEKARRADDVLANDGDEAALDAAVARYVELHGERPSAAS